jgi:cold shock CspA family protein
MAREGTEALARKCATFDPDGITVYMFASTYKRYDNVTPDKVSQIFAEHEPFGTTNTAGVLSDVFIHWAARKKAGELKNGETVLVITDGEPNDRQAVARVIKEVTGKMDADPELAISFLQVGKDQAAKQFLQHLDDGLEAEGAKFDIVDTKTFDEIEEKGMTLTDVLTAAIED